MYFNQIVHHYWTHTDIIFSLILVQLVDNNPALASAERRCEPGFYCSEGVKALCAPGTWGGEFGLVSVLFCFVFCVPIICSFEHTCLLEHCRG